MKKPVEISQTSWDMARNILSSKFTISIGNRLSEVIELAKNIDDIESYDYKFVTWNEFVTTSNVPDGILERANDWRYDASTGGYIPFDFVVYDPLDDDQGFLLLGNDGQELVREACEYIIQSEPEEGPLGVDQVAMTEVENA